MLFSARAVGRGGLIARHPPPLHPLSRQPGPVQPSPIKKKKKKKTAPPAVHRMYADLCGDPHAMYAFLFFVYLWARVYDAPLSEVQQEVKAQGHRTWKDKWKLLGDLTKIEADKPKALAAAYAKAKGKGEGEVWAVVRRLAEAIKAALVGLIGTTCLLLPLGGRDRQDVPFFKGGKAPWELASKSAEYEAMKAARLRIIPPLAARGKGGDRVHSPPALLHLLLGAWLDGTRPGQLAATHGYATHMPCTTCTFTSVCIRCAHVQLVHGGPSLNVRRREADRPQSGRRDALQSALGGVVGHAARGQEGPPAPPTSDRGVRSGSRHLLDSCQTRRRRPWPCMSNAL